MPYGKSNKSIQDAAFKLRSGNNIGGRNGKGTMFKKMGSSPMNPSALKQYKTPEKEGFTYGEETVTTHPETGVITYTKTGTKPGTTTTTSSSSTKSGGITYSDAWKGMSAEEQAKHGSEEQFIIKAKEYTEKTKPSTKSTTTPPETDIMSYSITPENGGDGNGEDGNGEDGDGNGDGNGGNGGNGGGGSGWGGRYGKKKRKRKRGRTRRKFKSKKYCGPGAKGAC